MSPDNTGRDTKRCYLIACVFRLNVYVYAGALNSRHVNRIRVKLLCPCQWKHGSGWKETFSGGRFRRKTLMVGSHHPNVALSLSVLKYLEK